MNDALSVVKTYVDAWNEPDEAARRQLLHCSWAGDGTQASANTPGARC
jgi:hypothetical protein